MRYLMANKKAVLSRFVKLAYLTNLKCHPGQLKGRTTRPTVREQRVRLVVCYRALAESIKPACWGSVLVKLSLRVLVSRIRVSMSKEIPEFAWGRPITSFAAAADLFVARIQDPSHLQEERRTSWQGRRCRRDPRKVNGPSCSLLVILIWSASPLTSQSSPHVSLASASPSYSSNVHPFKPSLRPRLNLRLIHFTKTTLTLAYRL